MAKGKIIDSGALYQSGVAGKDTAAAIAKQTADKQRALTEGIVRTAYSTLGRAAVGQLQRNYVSMQKFSNVADSITGFLDTEISKMPKDQVALNKDDMTLPQTVVHLREVFDKNNKIANWGIGKKRGEAIQKRDNALAQLKTINTVLEATREKAKTAKDMMLRKTGKVGGNNQGEMSNFSPGSSVFADDNTMGLANGEVQRRLRWNLDKQEMYVQVGGSFVMAEDATTGKTKNVYAPDDMLEAATGQKFEQIPFSDMRFSDKEDTIMGDEMIDTQKELVRMANQNGSMSWEQLDNLGTHFLELQNKIGDYTDVQFKDFYFGGYSYDHSTGRMDESAPAYQRLLSDGLTPGTYEWEGALLTLKEQSFIKGSPYRQQVTESIWEDLKTKYTNTRKNYIKNNPKETPGGLYHDTTYGSISKIRTNDFVNKLKRGEKTIKDIRAYNGKTYTWDLQDDGRYMTKDGENTFYRSPAEMMVENEMDAFYANDYIEIQKLYEAPSIETWNQSQNIPMENFKSEKDPVDYGPGTGTKEDPIKFPFEKGGQNLEPGKYYRRDNGKISLWTKKGWEKEKK